MYDISISAVRHSGVVQVSVNGYLASNCFEASIVGIYPGTVYHIVDPGCCEVFILESQRPDTIVCTQSLVPWTATTNITDTSHNKVSIFINSKEEAKADIIDEPTRFNVYGIVGVAGNFGCRIVPVGAVQGGGWFAGQHLFGPASHEESEAWMAENCSRYAWPLDTDNSVKEN